jgi:imidazolonepropionase
MSSGRVFLKNIHGLYQVATQSEARKSGAQMQDACLLPNAFVGIEDGRISRIGSMDAFDAAWESGAEIVDCSHRLVLPGFVDSHTHLVFARTREEEYVDRIKGMSYEEIAKRGGGILNSARRLREMSEDDLLQDAIDRAWEVLMLGTTTVEIKSGYGLSTESELKMLRVAKRIRDYCPIRIHTTFLGAHAIPMEFKQDRAAYVRLVCNEMIPAVAAEGLAEFVDVFCDKGFFTVDETALILESGIKHGLRPKIHANELAISGGVQVGIEYGALSVDHLECTGHEELAALAQSQTMPTVLPGCSFFLGIEYAQARKMIDAGLPVCVASDYNPGTSPAGNMQFMWSLACTRMKLLPEEALVAMTLNGAAALGVADQVGSIEVGKHADMLVTEPMEGLARMPYYYSRDQIEIVVMGGDVIEK